MDRRPAVAALAAIVVLAGAGCGGSGSLSRADLVKHVNAICKHRNAQSMALIREAHRDVRLATRRMLSDATKAIEDLAALDPPKALRARYKRFVAYERAFLANGRRTAAGQNPPELNIGHQRDALIRELGFTACK